MPEPKPGEDKREHDPTLPLSAKNDIPPTKDVDDDGDSSDAGSGNSK